jgi:glutamate carboxypeptidase
VKPLDFSPDVSRMVDQLRELVETESPSHDKPAVDSIGGIVVERCLSLGAKVEIVPSEKTGNQVVAKWNSDDAGDKKGILLLHHMDTVFPLGTLARMPFYEKEGKIFGPGVLDMKSGIVLTLTAIEGLIEAGMMPSRPVTALFTSDEEIGSRSSRALIEKLAGDAALVMVLEAAMPDGALKVWRKGTGDFIVKVKGRASHAGGAHQEGRNAIEEMAHQVLAIQGMTDYTKGTTLNVGRVSGGIASNVVPDECVAIVDFRVLALEEAERIGQAMQALKPNVPGTSIEVTGGLDRPPMPFDRTMKATFEKAKQIAAGLGMELKSGGTGGGSDANFVAPLDIPVLDGLGAIGDGYHSEREYLLKDSLSDRARLLAALISQW